MSTVEEHTSSEIITMRDSFGQELQSLRRALDTVSKEKAKLEIDADKFEKEARESRSVLTQGLNNFRVRTETPKETKCIS